jgi:hypothetical protein
MSESTIKQNYIKCQSNICYQAELSKLSSVLMYRWVVQPSIVDLLYFKGYHCLWNVIILSWKLKNAMS